MIQHRLRNPLSRIVEKVNLIFPLWVFIFNLLACVVGVYLEDLFSIETVSSELEDDFLNDIWLYIILIVLVAPILEELSFRLILTKTKYFWWFLVGAFYSYFSLETTMAVFKISWIVIATYLSASYFLNIFNIFNYSLSIIAFTFIHVVNYDLSDFDNLFLLLYQLIPQLILGICLTYTRIQYSFKTAVLYHILYNLIIIILYLFTQN